MSKEQEAVQASHGNEEMATVKEKFQTLFDVGAVFDFGQPKAVPAEGMKPREDVQVLDRISYRNVEGAHDGGNWFGVRLKGIGICRTADPGHVTVLRKLLNDPRGGHTGVHLVRV